MKEVKNEVDDKPADPGGEECARSGKRGEGKKRNYLQFQKKPKNGGVQRRKRPNARDYIVGYLARTRLLWNQVLLARPDAGHLLVSEK